MFKEFLILLVSILITAGVTSLVLAFPLAWLCRRWGKAGLGWGRAYVTLFLIEVSGYGLYILIGLVTAQLRPPVNNLWVSWAKNAVLLFIAGWIWTKFLLPGDGDGPGNGVRLRTSIMTVALILLKNLLLLFLVLPYLRFG